MKRVIVHTTTDKNLDFIIQDDEIETFKTRVNEGVRSLSSSPGQDFFWINMENVVYVTLADVKEEKPAEADVKEESK